MICCTCKRDKPADEFGKNASRPTGLQPDCRECRRECSRRWRQNATPEMLAKDYARTRNWHLRQNFGISLEEYEKRVAEQSGCCAACGKKETVSSVRATHRKRLMTNGLAVDHDHATGRVRGLLCERCNRTLGRVEDSSVVLQQLIDYLARNGA